MAAKFVGRSITRERVRHETRTVVLHEALAVVVVLIVVGVVAAGHGTVHAASAGGAGLPPQQAIASLRAA
jgi:hypothetical protein